MSPPTRGIGPGLVILGMGLLGACRPMPAPSPRPATPTIPLIPYQTPTVNPDPGLEFTPPAASATPEPTATPFTYTIIEGDTLLSIAFRFGVTVDEIVAVNPGIDARILSIGTAIVIPLGEEGAGVIAAPTPVPVASEAPICYPEADGGWWCFMVVLNEQPFGLEGVAAQLTLYDLSGEVIASQEAWPPVNVIPAGGKVPVVTFFPPPVPEPFQPAGALLSAFRLTEAAAERYLPARLEMTAVEYSPGGDQGRVAGRVVISGTLEEGLSGIVTVVVLAYDDAGNPLGLRRWEGEMPLVSGEAISFDIQVYSLGPPITSLETLAEVRPIEGGEG